MQTTLLALAIAIILALVTALVGPLLIDWSGHRSLFEIQASRLLGVDVRVAGDIDARLLPSPRLTLHDIEIGRPGPDSIKARSLGVEFALASLMRGEWRASDLQLSGLKINLGLDAGGRVHAPAVAVGFNPDALSVERLSVDDGALTLNDASNGASITLDKVWFNGDARSLLGPFKGEGAVTAGGELYPFRLSTGRYGDDGIKLHVNVDPVSRPLSIESDGMLTLANGDPKFDGTLSAARPVGVALRGAAVTQPWRASGKVKASAAAALFQQVEFQYGSDEQGLKLTGIADFKFGTRPRFDGVLSGRQIDLDRALGDAGGTRPLPAAAIRQLAELGGGVFKPSIPIQLGIGIDQITLAGGTVQNLRGDISTNSGAWNLDRFEFRAPGYTQARLSGRLAVDADSVTFTGPAQVDSNDPKVLTNWLEGNGETAPQDTRPMKLRGDVTLANDRFAIERLQAEFDRKTVTGRLLYAFAGAQPARLDATLNAPELDIDAALGFGKALLAGSKFEPPRNMTVAADIDRASFGGVTATGASARLKVDAQGLQIDRLTIADLGGGSLSASGRIDTSGQAPRGSLALDFESRQTAAIAALAEKYAPAAAKPLSEALGHVSRAKLHATLDIAQGPQPKVTAAQLTITGAADAMNVNIRTGLTGDWQNPASAGLRVDGTIGAPDSAALGKLLGLGPYLTLGNGAGQVKVSIAGPLDRDQQMDVRLTADGLTATATGRGRFSASSSLQLNSTLDVTAADIRPLAASPEPLPINLNSRVTIAGQALSFDDVTARLGRSTIHGKLAFDGDKPRKISGALEADTADAAALIAATTGMPKSAVDKSHAWTWSAEPFTSGLFGDYTGDVPLKVGRLEFSPRLTAREFRGTLHVGNDQIAVDEASADLAGGHLAGKLAFQASPDGLKAAVNVALSDVDAAAVLPANARPPVNGTLGLLADLSGSGLSPVALIGSLQGNAKLTLANGQLSGLGPRAFETVTRAVDQGLPIDAGRVSDVVLKAMDSGQLSVKSAEASLSVSAGQMRVSNATIASADADLSLSGTLDLTDGSLDARLILSGAARAAGARPDIFIALQGPITAPSRSIDVSALSGWLTLRSVENQTRQLHVMEAQPPNLEGPPAKPEAQATKPEAQPPKPARAPAAPSRPAPIVQHAPPLPPPLDIHRLPGPAR